MDRSAPEALPPSRKRKRALSREPSLGPLPLVVFNAPGGRTFRRVLKEESLNDFKRSIRAKLQLPQSVRLHLAEARNGRLIDLDDEDDFEAFQAAAGLETQLEVEVGVNGSDDHVGPSIDTVAHERPSKRGKTSRSKKQSAATPLHQTLELHSQAESVVAASRDASPLRGRSLHRPALDESNLKKKHKEKRSKSSARTPPPAPLLTQLIEAIGPAPGKVHSTKLTSELTRKRKKTRKLGTDLPSDRNEVTTKRKRKQAISDDDAMATHNQASERRSIEDESSPVPVAMPEAANRSQPEKAKKKRRMAAPSEAAVAPQDKDTEEQNDVEKHVKKKKKRKVGASDDTGTADKASSKERVTGSAPHLTDKTEEPTSCEGTNITPSDRENPPAEPLSPMTRRVNELLDIVYKNKPTEIVREHEQAESDPPSPQPPPETKQRAPATRNAGKTSGLTTQSSMLQDAAAEKQHKRRKAKNAPEDQITLKAKKKHRRPNEPECDRNRSPAAGTRTNDAEHESGNDLPLPSSPQRRETQDTLPATPHPPTEISAEICPAPVESAIPLPHRRNAVASPSSPIRPAPHVTDADLDAIDLGSLLRPSQAEQRKARTSLEALFNRGDEDPGDTSNEDVGASAHRDSESVRSSSPSDVRYGKKRNVRTSRVQQGSPSGSEDDVSDSPGGELNARHLGQWRDHPGPGSGDASATVGEGDKTGLDGSMWIAGDGQLLHATNEARKGHQATDGMETAISSETALPRTITDARSVVQEPAPSPRRRGQHERYNREANIESIDQFYTQRDRSPKGDFPMADHTRAAYSPVQPSSPWTPKDQNRSSLPFDASPSQIPNHGQSPDPAYNVSSPLRSLEVPTVEPPIAKYHTGEARVASARSSGAIINAREPLQSTTSLSRRDSLNGPMSLKNTSAKQPDAPACIASEQSNASRNSPTPFAKLAPDINAAHVLTSELLASTVEPTNGSGRGTSVGSAGTYTPGPTSNTEDERMKWAASYLRKSGMTKDVLRDFFKHEGVPLGKKADTKEKLFLQAIELMKTHPIYYASLKDRFNDAVEENKAQLRELPPPTVSPSPLLANPARMISTDSSGDANLVDRSLSVQPADSPCPSSRSGSAEIGRYPPRASVRTNGPRASMLALARLPRSQPIRGSRSSAPVMSLKNMTQDYVRSAVKSTARIQVAATRAKRPWNEGIPQGESDQDDDEESDDSGNVPEPSQIPPHRLAGAGLAHNAIRSIRSSLFASQ